MFTEEDVIQIIKSKYTASVALYYLTLLVMPGMFILLTIAMLGTRNPLGIALVAFMGTIASILTDLFLYKKIVKPAIKERRDVMTDPVFRIFKTPAELTAALNEAKQAEAAYEFNNIKVTDKYIVSFDDPRSIMRFEDVDYYGFGNDPRNNEGTALIVADNDHERTCFYSTNGDSEAARHIADLLAERCPNAKNRALEQGSVVTKM